MTPVPASPDPESGPPRGPRPVGGAPPPSRALRRPAGRRLPGLAAGRDAVADRSDVRRHRRLRARPLRHRHARASSWAGPARWRSATCCPAGAISPSSPGVFHVGGPCESDTALCLAIAPAARRRRGQPRCGAWPATSTWSTSTATRPTCPSSSPACGSSPGTPAGPPVSWPARSPRARGRACRGTPDDVLSAVVRARSCGAPSWAARPGRLAVLSHRAGGSDRQLRVPGCCASRWHLVGRTPGEGGLGKRPPSPAVFGGDVPAPCSDPERRRDLGMVGRRPRSAPAPACASVPRRRGRTASPSRRRRRPRSGVTYCVSRSSEAATATVRPVLRGRTARSAGCRWSAAPARCSPRRGTTAASSAVRDGEVEQHLDQRVEQRRRGVLLAAGERRCRYAPPGAAAAAIGLGQPGHVADPEVLVGEDERPGVVRPPVAEAGHRLRAARPRARKSTSPVSVSTTSSP